MAGSKGTSTSITFGARLLQFAGPIMLGGLAAGLALLALRAAPTEPGGTLLQVESSGVAASTPAPEFPPVVVYYLVSNEEELEGARQAFQWVRTSLPPGASVQAHFVMMDMLPDGRVFLESLEWPTSFAVVRVVDLRTLPSAPGAQAET